MLIMTLFIYVVLILGMSVAATEGGSIICTAVAALAVAVCMYVCMYVRRRLYVYMYVCDHPSSCQ